MSLIPRVHILYSILNRLVHHQLHTSIDDVKSAPIVAKIYASAVAHVATFAAVAKYTRRIV